jgi:hypothetical protein
MGRTGNSSLPLISTVAKTQATTTKWRQHHEKTIAPSATTTITTAQLLL